MRAPSPVHVLLSLLALLAPAPRPAHAAAAAGPGPVLAIRGLVALPSGAPVARARITAVARGADGAVLGPGRGFNATADDSGHFVLELPLPDRATVARRGYELNMWVTARSLHFTVLDGQASLGLDLHVETLPDGGARVVGAANDPRLAALAARAVATGARTEMTGALFTGVMGEQMHEPAMPRRLEVARIAVSAPATPLPPVARSEPAAKPAPAPAPATPKPAPASPRPETPAPRTAPRTPHSEPVAPRPDTAATRMMTPPPTAADSFRTALPEPVPVVSVPPKQPRHTASTPSGRSRSRKPGHGAPPPAPITAAVVHLPAAPEPARPAPDTAGCECHVDGTVEATAGDPLPAPLRVAVWVEGYPAHGDTITLEMGSPRPFALGGVPCGAHRLAVHALSERRFYEVRDAAHVLPIECRRDRHPQPRIELIPR